MKKNGNKQASSGLPAVETITLQDGKRWGTWILVALLLAAGLFFLGRGVMLALTRQGLSPDQAFVMPASDERARAYLRGESLALTQEEAGRTRDGWIPVCVDGFPLGWGKKSGQTVKNKYPPSWRQ